MSRAITEEQLSRWARQKPVRWVVVHAEWCGHCQRMKQRLLQMFADRPEFPVGSDGFPQTDFTKFVESEQAKQLQNIQGFPTVRKYVNGVAQPSNANELYDFLTQNVLAQSQPQHQQRRWQAASRAAPGPGPAVIVPVRPGAVRSRSPPSRMRRDLRPHEIVLPSRGALRAPRNPCGYRE